jgi:hypothetical protein
MKIGYVDFNEAFWKGKSFEYFINYFKALDFKKLTGLKPEQVAKHLGIEVPKDK